MDNILLNSISSVLLKHGCKIVESDSNYSILANIEFDDVELNDNMEQLRYFVFSSRWKWRIVRRYNLMFRGYVGKQLKNAYKNEICYKISYFSKFDTVKNTIIKTNKTLNDFRNDRKNKRQELEEFYFVVQNLSYDCIKTTEQLLSYCSKMESKNMIVVGSAGNGKTSLLCRATEMAIKYKYPCLMLNSRDIENKNVVDYKYIHYFLFIL